MLQSLRQRQLGAKLSDGEVSVESFGNDRQALQAARDGVALCDHSGWGLLQLAGSDRQQFLHNQTTNDINRLQPGQGCNTVFVNSTGRALDLVSAYLTDTAILILVSPNRRQWLMAWMDRYIFPMDKIELADISEKNIVFSLIGPDSSQLLTKLGLEDLMQQPEGNHCLVTLEGASLRLAVGSGLGLPGYTLIVPIADAAEVWGQFIAAGAIPMGDRAWEVLRIQQGRPAPDKELTEDYNPLEAGLWQAISFEKGCYIGQETIARLNTYQGVKQRLWGVKLNQPVEPGTAITVEDKKVGTITSFAEIEQQPFAIAYVRTKVGGEGLIVQIGEATGELVAVPYLTHEYYQASKI